MRAKRVVVAMSGGVDSSVCAALLTDDGFDVIGITMQMSGPSDSKAEAAKKTADKLGIEHRLLNFRDIFREKVIGDFCEEYKGGRTPNPCIKCNKYIKFGALLKEARRLGADYIATGHYARIEFDAQRKRYLLKKGIDSRKDQSYFLYTLSQEQLKQALFPLGAFTKDRAREVAQEKGLAAAESSESQEICFIPDNRYGEFLKGCIPERAHKPGSIVNKEGKVIGEHQGIIFYTIGQRKGIGIADREPLYVASIDRESNAIAVGRKKEVHSDELIAEDVNFISVDRLEAPMKVEVKVRYLHPPASATVVPQDKNKVRVKFERPQWAITPGQAAVFYRGDIVVGGGTIENP